MYTKNIKYVDYLGKERKEDFCFNLNEAELAKWLTTDGDYSMDKVIRRIIQEKNGRKIMETFEDLIKRSYGVVTLDGKRFMKSEELVNEFIQTEAYNVLFMELLTDTSKAVEFFIGIMPKDLSDDLAKVIKENPDGIPDEIKDYLPQNS